MLFGIELPLLEAVNPLMRRIGHSTSLAIATLAIIFGLAIPAVSRTLPSDDEWRAAHIGALPSEVAGEVYKWQGPCGGGPLVARRSFSRFMDIAGRRYLALHFEQLRCDNQTAICSAAGCLHEVYAFIGGRFRKVKSLQTPELQLTNLNNQAAIESDCGVLGCLRLLRWNGKRFIEAERPSVETEHIFGFTEGADIGAKGEIELENTFTNRFGKLGHYSALEGETSARYVFADSLRTSLGVLSDFHDVRGVRNLPDTTAINFNGLSSETRWQALDSIKAPFGVAVSLTPQWQRIDDLSSRLATTYAVPVRLLIDAAILPSKLFAAMNITYAPSVTGMNGVWERQSAIEVSAAISGSAAPGVFLGAELRHLAAYQGVFLNRDDGKAFFVGPSLFLQFRDSIVLKLTWSAQISGTTPNGVTGPLNLTRFERNQVRAQLVKSF